MTNLIDFILSLFRDPVQAGHFVAAPAETLKDAGLPDVSADQLQAVTATVVPAGVALAPGNPVASLQRAVADHHGIAPSLIAPPPISHHEARVLSPETNLTNDQGLDINVGDITLGDSVSAQGAGAVAVGGDAGDITTAGSGHIGTNGQPSGQPGTTPHQPGTTPPASTPPPGGQPPKPGDPGGTTPHPPDGTPPATTPPPGQTGGGTTPHPPGDTPPATTPPPGGHTGATGVAPLAGPPPVPGQEMVDDLQAYFKAHPEAREQFLKDHPDAVGNSVYFEQHMDAGKEYFATHPEARAQLTAMHQHPASPITPPVQPGGDAEAAGQPPGAAAATTTAVPHGAETKADMDAYFDRNPQAREQYMHDHPDAKNLSYFEQHPTAAQEYFAANPSARAQLVEMYKPGIPGPAGPADFASGAKTSDLDAYFKQHPDARAEYQAEHPNFGSKDYYSENQDAAAKYFEQHPQAYDTYLVENPTARQAYFQTHPGGREAYQLSHPQSPSGGDAAVGMDDLRHGDIEKYFATHPDARAEYIKMNPDAEHPKYFEDNPHQAYAYFQNHPEARASVHEMHENAAKPPHNDDDPGTWPVGHGPAGTGHPKDGRPGDDVEAVVKDYLDAHPDSRGPYFESHPQAAGEYFYEYSEARTAYYGDHPEILDWHHRVAAPLSPDKRAATLDDDNPEFREAYFNRFPEARAEYAQTHPEAAPGQPAGEMDPAVKAYLDQHPDAREAWLREHGMEPAEATPNGSTSASPSGGDGEAAGTATPASSGGDGDAAGTSAPSPSGGDAGDAGDASTSTSSRPGSSDQPAAYRAQTYSADSAVSAPPPAAAVSTAAASAAVPAAAEQSDGWGAELGFEPRIAPAEPTAHTETSSAEGTPSSSLGGFGMQPPVDDPRDTSGASTPDDHQPGALVDPYFPQQAPEVAAAEHTAEGGFVDPFLRDLSAPQPAVAPDVNDLKIGKWDLFDDETPAATDPVVDTVDPAVPISIEVENSPPADMDSPDIQYQIPQEQAYEAPQEEASEAPQGQADSYSDTPQHAEPEQQESSAQYGVP